MVKKEHLFSSVHNQQLAETLVFPEQFQQKKIAILFIHGWRSNQEGALEYAEALAQGGFICLTFDLRGHGSSDGNMDVLTRRDYVDDVLTAYDTLVTVASIDPEHIGVIGASFGGYLGAMLTARRKVKSLALRVPADYSNEGFEKPQVLLSDAAKRVWQAQEHQPHESCALHALHTFTGEVLIVESGKDEQISHQTIANYTNTLNDKEKLTYIVMKEAGHRLQDHTLRAEYKQILINWFSKTVGTATLNGDQG